MSQWRDKHVMITGASSGIGLATAELLAGRGARLSLVARRAEALAASTERLRRGGASVTFAAVDVLESARLTAEARRFEAELGPCELMIAAAGIHHYTPGEAFRGADARRVLDTNVVGVINAIDAVLPGMVARGRGHLTAVASIAAMLGLPGVGAYSASKAAVVALLESLRVDLYRCGVRVTTICPGFVDTPMLGNHDRRVLKFLLSPNEAAARIVRAIEQNRAEAWFPWQTWLMARTARWLPFGLYRRLVAHTPPRPPDQSNDEGFGAAPA